MTTRVSDLQRQFGEGSLVLPAVRPAAISERAWITLVRHVREHVPYRALAAELQVSESRVRTLAAQAAAALQYPELVDLPGASRRPLVLGGYTTRAAVAGATDAELLLLKEMSPARLCAVRAVIPRTR